MKHIKLNAFADIPVNYTGMATVTGSRAVCYKVNGEYHREDGPAIEYFDGNNFWYYYGKLHREDGPAIEDPQECVYYWYYHDKLHRFDGPAVVSKKGGKSYFIYGKEIEGENAYKLLINMMKLKGLI